MILNWYKKRKERNRPDIKLHVGCGENYFDGWINVDIDSSKADIFHDLAKPLWFYDNTVDFIYSEHFIEHIGIKHAQNMFKEFYRVLKPGGILRIATPDLDYLVKKYVSASWKDQDWIEIYNYQRIQTRAEMLNICFREWGHQYLYDAEELERRLREVGFGKISRQEWNVSMCAELANRETRKDSKLIIEAVKQGR
jgi:predicted SAM-dependent methyltransferase